jgi:hypothetical protein
VSKYYLLKKNPPLGADKGGFDPSSHVKILHNNPFICIKIAKKKRRFLLCVFKKVKEKLLPLRVVLTEKTNLKKIIMMLRIKKMVNNINLAKRF